MRKMISFLWLVNLMSVLAFAQQRPHYSQYLQNMSVLNPAITGLNTGTDIRMGIRTQWTGLKDAPKTGYVTLSAPISSGGDRAGYRPSGLGIITPETKEAMLDYSASVPHHGLGLVFLNDKTGPLNRLTGNLTYAYHLALGDATNLSFGIGFGVNRLNLNAQALVFDEVDDPVVGTAAQINKYTPDLNAGIYWYGSSFYFGASMQQIIKNKISFDGEFMVGKEVAHYFATAGYQFWIDNDLSVTPSLMLKIVAPLPKAFDLNLRFAYRDTFWLGGGLRKDDALSFYVGFNVAKMVGLGYAFDYTTSELRTVSTGAHELTLRVLF